MAVSLYRGIHDGIEYWQDAESELLIACYPDYRRPWAAMKTLRDEDFRPGYVPELFGFFNSPGEAAASIGGELNESHEWHDPHPEVDELKLVRVAPPQFGWEYGGEAGGA